jgi:hypothetical protein
MPFYNHTHDDNSFIHSRPFKRMSSARLFNTKTGNAVAASAMPVPAATAAAGLVPAPAINNNTKIAAMKTAAVSKLKGWNAANAAALAATTNAARVRARAFKLALLAHKGRGADAASADNAAESVVVLPLPAAAQTVVPAPEAALEPSLVETTATNDNNTGDTNAAAAAPTTTTAAAKVKNWHAAAKAALVAKALLARSRAVALLSRKKGRRATPLDAIEVEACAADAENDNSDGSGDSTSEGALQPAVACSDAGRRATMRARMTNAWAALASRAASKAPKAPSKKRALPSVQAVRGYFSACVAPGKKAVAAVA